MLFCSVALCERMGALLDRTLSQSHVNSVKQSVPLALDRLLATKSRHFVHSIPLCRRITQPPSTAASEFTFVKLLSDGATLGRQLKHSKASVFVGALLESVWPFVGSRMKPQGEWRVFPVTK